MSENRLRGGGGRGKRGEDLFWADISSDRLRATASSSFLLFKSGVDGGERLFGGLVNEEDGWWFGRGRDREREREREERDAFLE